MMKLLLDTHALIWLANNPENLSSLAVELIQDRSNDLLLSVVSVWEMAIKLQLGKLQLNRSLSSLIITQQQVNDLQILTVQLVHVLAVESLPVYHKDPFDRLLIAQAITENLPILSVDEVFDHYPIQRLWAN
jgi:PIN domain nuclease of toxin-antitoxin system